MGDLCICQRLEKHVSYKMPVFNLLNHVGTLRTSQRPPRKVTAIQCNFGTYDAATGQVVCERIIRILPEDTLPAELRTFMMKHHSIIAGSFATHWAQKVMKSNSPIQWNDIDVFVAPQDFGMVDSIPGKILDQRYTSDYPFASNVLTDHYTHHNKAIYDTEIVDETGKTIKIQYIAFDSNGTCFFQENIETAMDFTVATSTIQVTDDGTILLNILYPDDTRDNVLRMQNYPTLTTTQNRIDRWRARGFVGDIPSKNIVLRDVNLSFQDVFGVGVFLHDHKVTLTNCRNRFIACKKVHIVCDNCEYLIIENCNEITVSGNCNNIVVYYSEVHFESPDAAVLVQYNYNSKIHWAPTVHRPGITGLIEMLPENRYVKYYGGNNGMCTTLNNDTCTTLETPDVDRDNSATRDGA
jgi:hypothetical protein